ncbi:MAG: type VII toxin-antitoxin system HepT family RNase toxin [Myxococcota bacterium]
MVQRDVASQKIARARAFLADAEPVLSLPRAEFLVNRKERDLALFYLFLAIQECIDLATHWIADEGLPPADDYAASFEILAERGRIEPLLAQQMAGAAGLRNLIAHGYAAVDPSRVHEEAAEGIAAMRRFMEAVARVSGAD